MSCVSCAGNGKSAESEEYELRGFVFIFVEVTVVVTYLTITACSKFLIGFVKKHV